MVSVMFVFWLLGLSTIDFSIKIVFTLILELICITFIVCFIFKLSLNCIFINVFIQNLAKCFRNVLYVLLRIISIVIIFCFIILILLICIFINLLHVLRSIFNVFYIVYSLSVSIN